MTSDIGVEHSHGRRRFHLHCACGATVVTSARTAICTDCGEKISFHRGWQLRQIWSPELPKQVPQELLLIVGLAALLVVILYLFGLGWSIVASLLVAGIAGELRQQIAPRTTHGAAIFNYEKRYFYLGLLILLFALLVASLPIISSDAFQERIAVLNTPKPSDCDWSHTPLGDKHCHYESSVSHVSDRSGKHVSVEWRRVDD